MSKIWKNDKNFKIIKLSWREYVVITDTFGLCDVCADNSSEEDIFFVAVLNQYYCEKCLNAWYKDAKKYKSDIEKEQHNFVNVKHKLEDIGTWENE